VVTSTGLRPRASSRAPIGREGILRKVTLFGGGGDPLQKRILTHGAYPSERLNDPEYLGWRHERIIGQDYFDFEQIHPARETCEG
jgi:hypothetical protein